jgi:hypothetical protein
MSKFLLNLLLQISKALVNSKIQFLIWKFFFLILARPTLRPTQPLAQPAHWPHHPRRPKPSRPAHLAARRSHLHGKYVFPFGSCLPSRPPLPRLSVNQAPDVSSIPHLQPPELTHAATAPQPPSTAQLHASGATGPLPPRLHFPSLKSPLKPSPVFNGVKAINAGIKLPGHPSSALPRPPRKGQLHSRNIPHLLHASPELLPLFTSFSTRTERR